MKLLQRNIIANLTGNVWSAVLSISTIPFYIHFMGVESYGLIGFSIAILSFFRILDLLYKRFCFFNMSGIDYQPI